MPTGVYIRKHPVPNFLGRKHSLKTKKKMSKIHLGQIPWNKGIPTREETKTKISKKLKGVKKSTEWIDKLVARQTGKKRSPLTEEHKMKLSKLLSGKNSPCWKGGVYGTERHRLMGGREYKLWRKSCIERDNFVCQKYLTSGGVLDVHHINNYSEYPELRLAIDNGITLSKKAHQEFHKKYGCKNNTREQLEEFLSIKQLK